MEQAKPQAKRQHSPVWETLYAVRRQLKYAGLAQPRARQRQEQAPAHASVPARKSPPSAQADTKVGFWARETGKGLVLLPLQLLWVLMNGYQPQASKPQIRWLTSKRNDRKRR